MNKQLIVSILVPTTILIFSLSSLAQNNACSNALVIDVGDHEVVSFSGNGAIFDGASAAAWYRYEPKEKGVFRVNSCRGGADTRLVIMLLEDCENQTDLQIINSAEDNCDDGERGNTASNIEVVAVPGFSYVIYWDNGQSNDGFIWNLDFTGENQLNSGETCETADTILAGVHQIDSLTGAGTAFLDAVSARWFTYIPERNGALFISACESEVNTRLFVFDGTCESVNILAQDDDSCGQSGASDIGNVLVDSGKTYMVYWDDHWTNEGFDFNINVSDPTTSTNEPVWAKNIQIFPNPADNQLFIDYYFGEQKDVSATIYNALGQPVWMEQWKSFQQGRVGVLLNDLPNGAYYLSIRSNLEQNAYPFIISH